MSSSGHDDDSPERLARDPVGAAATTTTTNNNSNNNTNNSNSRRVKKKRVRNFTEDDRAAHRIFEKSRREAFKEALTNLASLLPALADTEPQRLSKHVVVDESITFIRSQHGQLRATTERLEAVERERNHLLAELSHWRSGAGISPQQANGMGQPPIGHSDAGTAPGAVLGAVPPTLQHSESPIPMISDAAPSFLPNALHEPNPSPLTAADASAGMHWEGFEPQVHGFANHVQGGDAGPNGMGNAGPAQLGAYQTHQSPQSPSIPQFGMSRAQQQQQQQQQQQRSQQQQRQQPQQQAQQQQQQAQQQHGPVFLPFEPPQPFNPGGFQTDTFMQNATPLQNYIPP